MGDWPGLAGRAARSRTKVTSSPTRTSTVVKPGHPEGNRTHFGALHPYCIKSRPEAGSPPLDRPAASGATTWPLAVLHRDLDRAFTCKGPGQAACVAGRCGVSPDGLRFLLVVNRPGSGGGSDSPKG